MGDGAVDKVVGAEEAPVRAALRELAGLFVVGLGGGLLTLLGTGVLMAPRGCCGATPAQQEARELRRECLARGITPEELLAERAAAATPSAAAEAQP